MKRLYRLLVQPHSEDRNIKRREVVFNYLLLGTLGLVVVGGLIVFYGWLSGQATYNLAPVFAMLGIFILAVISIYTLGRTDHYKVAAVSLAVIYIAISLALIGMWSLRNPMAISLLTFSIIMVGILISARASLYAAFIISVALFALHFMDTSGVYRPDLSWMKRPASVYDVIGLSFVFAVLALVAWLYNRELEFALVRAETTEAALLRQKQTLAVKVERRTRQLQTAQAAKMKQLYRFAELGHVSSALLHDISNHISMLSMDIDVLGEDHVKRNEIVEQSRKSIGYIEQLIDRVRYQLQGDSIIKKFNIVHEVAETFNILAYKARKSGVGLELEITSKNKKALTYKGDFVGFRQLIGNVLANSIEAYDDQKNRDEGNIVKVAVGQKDNNFVISFTDWGRGISPSEMSQIFDPFFSTREEGMGIGLFIARQLAENQFGGRLTVASEPKSGTAFTFTMPKERSGYA